MAVTERGAVPTFWTWAGSCFELPTTTVPNPRVAGEKAIAAAEGFAPLPLRVRLTVGWSASLLASARHPESPAAPVGV